MNDLRDSAAPAVILNMHYTGLGLARALRACGVGPIYGLGAHSTLFGNFSRHAEYVPSPDTLLAPKQCRDFLLSFARRFEARPVLFPTRDHDLQFISRFYDELAEHYVLAAAPPGMMQSILNKADLYQVAEAAGVACPATAWIDSRVDLESALPTLRYPVIVKPVYSAQWRRAELWDLVGRQKAAVIGSEADLRRFYARIEAVDPVIHVQEFIPGDDTNLVVFGSYVDRSRTGTRFFTARKLLQYPPQSGTGVAVQALPVPDIVEPSHRLLARLGYRGISELEYKFDPRSKEYVLIEMNPRFWDQHALGVAAGVNLAQCAYLDLTGGRLPEQQQSMEPVTWIAEDGYAMSFLRNLRTRSYPVSDFLAALKGRRALAVYEGGDARPAITVTREFARDVSKLVWGRVRRPASPGKTDPSTSQ